MSTGFTESWKSILCKFELELMNKLIEENAYNFFKQCHEINLSLMNLKVIVVKYHLSNGLVN